MTAQKTDKPDYVRKIEKLLSNYEDGKNVFIKANDWDAPLRIKPKSQGKPIPTQWLDLVETVVGIIAHEKYGLETYPNRIEVIDSRQMISAYARVGMPVGYDHWSFGKEMISNERSYEQGKMGLAYEIVINTNPARSYCMTSNTKMMQILVIAHAAFGHNSFFHGNHLFTQFTAADDIIQQLERTKDFVRECEEKHGIEAVEAVLDAAHALQNHGVHRYTKPRRRTPEEEKKRRERIEEAIRENYDPVMERTLPRSGEATKTFDTLSAVPPIHLENEENLLLLVAKMAPHLPEWKRELIKQISEIAQYFYPQMQTQLMNEGWATFWHYTLVNDLYDLDLIDDGMMLEFLQSHTSVVTQPGFDSPYFSGINPYALGFAMYQDIKRICLNPTEEDRETFPSFAGNQDWVSVLKDAMESHKDESFVAQYLSPKVIRDFRLFSFEDDRKKPVMTIEAIHDERGYRQLRHDLSAQYNLGDRQPRIEAVSYFFQQDRTLLLQHIVHNERPLEDKNALKVLGHVQSLWGHPVVLQSVTPDGDVLQTYGCPKVPKVIKTIGPKPALTIA